MAPPPPRRHHHHPRERSLSSVGGGSRSVSSSGSSSRQPGTKPSVGKESIIHHHGHHHTGVTGVVSDDNRTDSRLLEWEAAFALDFGHNWENAYTSNNTQQHTLPKDYDEVRIFWLTQLMGAHHRISSTKTSSIHAHIEDLQSIMNSNFQAFSALVRSSIPNNNHIYTDGYYDTHVDDVTTDTTINNNNNSKRSRSSSSSVSEVSSTRHNSKKARAAAAAGAALAGVAGAGSSSSTVITHTPSDNTIINNGPVLHVTGGMFIPIIHQRNKVNNNAAAAAIKRSISSSSSARSAGGFPHYDTIHDDHHHQSNTTDIDVNEEFVIGRSSKDLLTATEGKPSSYSSDNDYYDITVTKPRVGGSNIQEPHPLPPPSLNLVNLPGSQAISRRHAIIRRSTTRGVGMVRQHSKSSSSPQPSRREKDSLSSDWMLINNSLNGTEVDSKLLKGVGDSALLHHGSSIRVGRQTFAFYDYTPTTTTQ